MTTADRQDAIETACHNAIRAIADEVTAAAREQRSPDARLALAAALEVIMHERGLCYVSGGNFLLRDVISHLRRTAAPRGQA